MVKNRGHSYWHLSYSIKYAITVGCLVVCEGMKAVSRPSLCKGLSDCFEGGIPLSPHTLSDTVHIHTQYTAIVYVSLGVFLSARVPPLLTRNISFSLKFLGLGRCLRAFITRLVDGSECEEKADGHISNIYSYGLYKLLATCTSTLDTCVKATHYTNYCIAEKI